MPVENYLNLDAWPINDMYENLIEISSYGGVLYGLPQDAESRPLFFWKPHMKAIGYSDADLDALPAKVQSGEYTLANVIEDAKKMQDKGVVKPGYGFYPRPNNGPDYWQFYTSFGGVMEEGGKLVLDKAAMQRFYQFFVDAVAAGVTRKNHIGTPSDQWFAEVARGQGRHLAWRYLALCPLRQSGGPDRLLRQRRLLAHPRRRGGKANTLTHPLVYLLTKNKSEENDRDRRGADQDRVGAAHQRAACDQVRASGHHQAGVRTSTSTASDRWAREATERLLPHANAMPNNSDFRYLLGTPCGRAWRAPGPARRRRSRRSPTPRPTRGRSATRIVR